MSNSKLVATALALIAGVVVAVAWYLAGESAARRAQVEERRPPVLEQPATWGRPTSALHGVAGASFARRATADDDCPCRMPKRG